MDSEAKMFSRYNDLVTTRELLGIYETLNRVYERIMSKLLSLQE